MDSTKIQRLKEVKERFRALPAKEREVLSIAMLKVNLGVNNPEELKQVLLFLEGLPLDLKPGKLDAFMNYLHSTENISPADLSGWFPHDAVRLDSSSADKEVDLPPYQEDEVETLKDQIPPFGKGRMDRS